MNEPTSSTAAGMLAAEAPAAETAAVAQVRRKQRGESGVGRGVAWEKEDAACRNSCVQGTCAAGCMRNGLLH